jgi:TniQ
LLRDCGKEAYFAAAGTDQTGEQKAVMTLSRRIQPGFNEPAPGYFSRLAAHNFRQARFFAADMEIPYQAVIDGNEEAVRRVAELGDVPSDLLMQNSVIRISPTEFNYKGQSLRRRSMRRARMHVCPRCLQADIAGSDLPATIAIHGRADWMIAALRTCAVHNAGLVEVARDVPVHETHDWTANVSPFINDLESLADSVPLRNPSSLERYLLDRFGGQSAGLWLDDFPVYAAAHIAEVVGAVVAFGKNVNLDNLTEDQEYESGHAGFELLEAGPAGIETLMAELHHGHHARRAAAADGPQAFFGKLYVSFSQGLPDRAYDPIRTCIRDQILQTFPLGPGDEIFGVPVESRRFHSIRTASLQYKMHSKRLRRLIEAEGLITDKSRPDHKIIFSAEIAERLHQREQASMSMKEAEKYLNAGRVQTRILLEAGFIQRHKIGEDGLEDVFFKAELDEFISRLLKNAQETAAFSAPVFDLPSAAKRACCSSTAIVKLILENRLQWVGRRVDETGFLSILVDVTEVKAKTMTEAAPAGLAVHIAAKIVMKTTQRVMSQLIAGGHIKTVTAINPVNRCPQIVIPFEELERFKTTFVSLHQLGVERGCHMRAVLKELNASGVQPANEFEKVGATFYRRNDLRA